MIKTTTNKTNNLESDFSFEKYGTLDTPRQQQLEVIPKIIESFKTKKFFILEAPTGCHAKGTKILMYDGSTKNVEDIVVGDLLMGPDSQPRKVLKLHSGKDKMYEIIPEQGNSFIVNSEHILSLCKINNNIPFKFLCRNKHKENNNPIVNLSLKKYIHKNIIFKHNYKLYKSQIEFPEIKTKINPYILGLGLGEENVNDVIEKEIINEIYSEANKGNFIVEKILRYNFNLTRKDFKNILQNDLKRYNLINNNEIPTEYKINSIQNRLELLAGIIDAHGFFVKNSCAVIYKDYNLISDIQFLADSLGFVTNLKSYFGGSYFQLNIFGKINTIPIRIENLKNEIRKQKREITEIGFKIKNVGINDYYGFEIDGDNLYLMDNFIVTHNSGKSMIATTLCNYYSQSDNRTTILCHQKVLQEQYLNENWRNIQIKNVTSSSNYICSKNIGLTCSQINKINKGKQNNCPGGCKYLNDKNNFISAPIGLTNMQFFLNFMLFHPVAHNFYRNLMVIDEAHSIEDQFLNFISVDISEESAKNKLGLLLNSKRMNATDCIKWISDEVKNKVEEREEEYCKKCISLLKKKGKKNEDAKLMKYSHEYEYYTNYLKKINFLIDRYDPDTWAFDIDNTERGSRIFSFKPILIDKYTNDFLFNKADKFLLMSATILGAERFCENVGIDLNEGVEFISLPSTFSLERRPIYYFNSGKMGKKHMDLTLPNMTKDIEKIMDKYENQKGIIFCHTYKIGSYIKEHIQGINGERLLFHTSKNRQAILDWHLESKEPTVLLTPSLSEGINLNQDLSRFQILCKIPFPYLGDERVVKKMKRFNWWYAYKTVKSVVQSLGRSIRSDNDWADSYILDGDWTYFFNKNKDMFPVWISEAITNDIQKLMFLF